MINPDKLIDLSESFLDELDTEINLMRRALKAFKKKYSDTDEYTLIRSIVKAEYLAHKYRLSIKELLIL